MTTLNTTIIAIITLLVTTNAHAAVTTSDYTVASVCFIAGILGAIALVVSDKK